MMNTNDSLKVDNGKIAPKAKYDNAQLYFLNKIEGKHDQEPDKSACIIAIGLSGIEAGVAFFLLLPAGLLMASIGAMFPVFLLWAMANFQAERVELPKKCDELVEQYKESFDA